MDEDGTVTPPTFRADILLMNDVAEEIARMYGYDKIPSTVMRGVATARLTERQQFERELARRLAADGLYETKTAIGKLWIRITISLRLSIGCDG